MKQIRLAWVVHFHQPLGNFGEVFEEYTVRVCRPFLTALERHACVRCSLHFSGVLLEYLKKSRGDVLDQIRELADRGQVELLGGGFYEPILSMIPREDAEWQLRKTIEWMQKELGYVPRGAWLPESVWEPHFVELLHRTGYQYTTLEDSLFESVGWKKAQLFRAFSADFLNRRVVLFPSQRAWAHQLPFEGMREIKAAFTQLGNRQDNHIVTIAQNGDRYGLEPGTYAAAYENGALEEWLRYLEGEQRWIETSRLGDIPEQRWPAALLPPGAAEHLEECALPSPAQRDFQTARGELAKRYDADRFLGYFRGGTWYGFIGKYAEAGLMHHKLLWLREQVLQLPYCQEREEAMELLLAAEEHSVYWHIRSGGVYANYLRDAVYQRLIRAEQHLHARDRDPEEAPKLLQADCDGDGHDEVMLRSALASIVVTPQYGGSLCEYSFWPTFFNVGNTFRRRVEAYHDAAGPLAPVEDWYERRLFQDHFVPPNTNRAAFAANDFVEYGDFIDQPYRIVHTASEREAGDAVLERHGGLYIGGERRPLTCRKSFRMENPGRLTVDYTITNTGNIPTDALFVCEVNYTCLSGDAPDRLFRWDGGQALCGEAFAAGKIPGWTIEDGSRDFLWRWHVEGGAEVWHHPVHTATFNQGKLEENYQSSAIQLVWPLRLAAGAAVSFRVVCEAEKLRP